MVVVLLFLAAGSVFALLFVFNLILGFLRRAPKIGFLHMLLAFLAALVSLTGLIANQMRAEPLVLVNRLAIGIAVLVIVPSVIVFLLELRRPERFKASRGVLGLGVGVLLILSTFTVPLTAESTLSAISPSSTPVIVAARLEESTSEVTNDTPTRTPSATPSPSATSTLTATRIRPTATATATRFQLMTRTPVPTATLPNPCVALTLYNVNLRAEPDSESDLLTTIPYNTSVTLFGRDDDATWWFAQHEDQAGWLDGEFLTLSISCNDLPERSR
jgi:hypothetical protein